MADLQITALKFFLSTKVLHFCESDGAKYRSQKLSLLINCRDFGLVKVYVMINWGHGK